MPNQFNHDTVQQYGGVAWAKEQIKQLDPGAIDDQIQGYANVKTSLNQIVDTLNTANTSIQSSWSGSAATAAAQTFTDTSNHAQNVVTTVNNTITQLQTAKTAATNAKIAMASVPDEKPVPSGGLVNGVTNTVSDIFTGTDPAQQAQLHNTTARTQAADVLNSLSNSYDTAATNMTSIANGGTEGGGFTPTNPPAGSFNLGSGSYGGGSGAARNYSSSTSNVSSTTSRSSSTGGVTNGVFEDGHTSLQSAATLPAPSSASPIGTGNLGTNTTTTTPGPIFGGLGGNLSETSPQSTKSGAANEENLFGNSAEEGHGSGKSKLGSSNVFDEEGFGNESGSGPGRRGSGLGAAAGEEAGGSAGQQSGMQRGGGAGRGGGSDEEELGSSKYSRGRFFDGEEPGSGRDEWVQPSVGGDESLLVKGGGRGSGTGRVTSAYEGATDADGNPLHMFRGVSRPGGTSDEEDERGERPGYLKENPECWQSAQRVAPPVVE